MTDAKPTEESTRDKSRLPDEWILGLKPTCPVSALIGTWPWARCILAMNVIPVGVRRATKFTESATIATGMGMVYVLAGTGAHTDRPGVLRTH